MAKYLAQIVIAATQLVSKAFVRALREEMASGRSGAASASANSRSKSEAKTVAGMTLQEAKQILNVDNLKTSDLVQQNYDHLFKVNDKGKGGSFYLQSKVVRAKERIDTELGQIKWKEKIKESEKD
ncbi:hypothetical protein SNEBB_010127 [Seison nebaliae]|nr:hypothetical protein SNEBB_010127 [Seison nebaliae]